MNNILNQINPSIADGIRIFASQYEVNKHSEAFEECISYALSYWYGNEKNVELLKTLPAETIKRRTMNALNDERKKEMKHNFRETTFTDLEANIDYSKQDDSTLSARDYIEAGGTDIDRIDDLIDHVSEKNKKCKDIIGKAWIDLDQSDENYLKWTALWSSLNMLAEKQRRYARKHLYEKRKAPYNEVLEELGKKPTYKNIMRASRAFKELKEKANVKLNEWRAAGKIED